MLPQDCSNVRERKSSVVQALERGARDALAERTVLYYRGAPPFTTSKLWTNHAVPDDFSLTEPNAVRPSDLPISNTRFSLTMSLRRGPCVRRRARTTRSGVPKRGI